LTKPIPCHLLLATFLCQLVVASAAFADQHVAVTAFAKSEYTQRKYENGKPRLETYVFMQGKYFEGRTADRSIERLTFRQLVEFLAPELARQNYLPTPELKAADLLLVVHWGTTVPLVESDPSRTLASIPTADEVQHDLAAAWASDPSTRVPEIDHMSDWNISSSEPYRAIEFEQLDQNAARIENDFRAATNAQLLGYVRDLRRAEKSAFLGTAEATLRSDLASERYFIIIKAYDLKDPQPAGHARRAVWTLYLNMRSPGQNFTTALSRMGNVAVDYFGRSTDSVVTARPHERTGTVTLGPLTIVGEVPDLVRAK